MLANCCLDAAGNNYGCDASGNYVFADWKDVLAVVYAGQNHTSARALLGTTSKTRNPARINCASPVRKALADNWGTLFNTNCAATGDPLNCVKLKHAFRRGDLSGTTDTFVTLVGLAGSGARVHLDLPPEPGRHPDGEPGDRDGEPVLQRRPAGDEQG